MLTGMQDYDVAPGYHPMIGEGMWPDRLVNTLGLVLILAALVLCILAYRLGQSGERSRRNQLAARSPEIIFAAIRRQIDIALMATGEGIFRPARTLSETIDAYLGPVLKVHEGPLSLGGTIHKLKGALSTTKKKVPDDHGHGGHGGQGGQGGHGPSTVIITSGGGAGAQGGGGPTASASASVGGGGSVQVLDPVRVVELPHGGGHGHQEPKMKEVELTSRERALAVRDALEALSEAWQKERVERQLKAAQQALLIDKPIGGEKPGVQPRARPSAQPAAQARAPGAARTGFNPFKF